MTQQRPTLTPLPNLAPPSLDEKSISNSTNGDRTSSPNSEGGSSINSNATNGSSGANNQQSHGTSAGYCNICKKYVSNRTNHKYVHSQVFLMIKFTRHSWNRVYWSTDWSQVPYDVEGMIFLNYVPLVHEETRTPLLCLFYVVKSMHTLRYLTRTSEGIKCLCSLLRGTLSLDSFYLR